MRHTSLKRSASLVCALALTVLMSQLAVQPANAQLVLPRGSDTTFDIATWNVREFPISDGQTVNVMTLMLRDLQLDLVGMEEITSETDFNTMVNNIGGWSGVVGNDNFGERLGILYNNSKVQLGNSYEIFTNNSYSFPRAPLVAPVTMVEAGDTLSFNFVVVHLKAYDTQEDRDRRSEAIDSLKAFIDRKVNEGIDTKWMVVGDFNDEITDPSGENVFLPMLNDTSYVFLTQAIAENAYMSSYPSRTSLIDHLLVTSALYADYGESGVTETLRLDDEYANYMSVVSDHRPVASYFPALNPSSAPERNAALPGGATLAVWPVPANAGVSLSFTLPGAGSGAIEVYDLLGRLVHREMVNGTSGRAVWMPRNAPSGIYLVRLEGGGATVVKRAVIVK